MIPGPRLSRFGGVVLGVFSAACASGFEGQLDPKEGNRTDADIEQKVGPGSLLGAVPVGAQLPADEEDEASLGAPTDGPPIVTYPGFRSLDAGQSRVFVDISKRVEVTETAEGNVLTLHLKGVTVPEKVNRLALPTAHFESPVLRALIVPSGDGADLVIELRTKTTHSTKLRASRFGVRLAVEFPKWTPRRPDALSDPTVRDVQEPPSALPPPPIAPKAIAPKAIPKK